MCCCVLCVYLFLLLFDDGILYGGFWGGRSVNFYYGYSGWVVGVWCVVG